MELLYSTLLPYGRVHCLAWSGINLVALSVSEEVPDYVTEENGRCLGKALSLACMLATCRLFFHTYFRVSSRSLLVFNPDRPWSFHK